MQKKNLRSSQSLLAAVGTQLTYTSGQSTSLPQCGCYGHASGYGYINAVYVQFYLPVFCLPGIWHLQYSPTTTSTTTLMTTSSQRGMAKPISRTSPFLPSMMVAMTSECKQHRLSYEHRTQAKIWQRMDT